MRPESIKNADGRPIYKETEFCGDVIYVEAAYSKDYRAVYVSRMVIEASIQAAANLFKQSVIKNIGHNTLPPSVDLVPLYTNKPVRGLLDQRCMVHFMRNILCDVPRSRGKEVGNMLKAIFAQEDYEACKRKAAEILPVVRAL